MTTHTDILIVGGGVIGLVLAWELSSRNHCVRILEPTEHHHPHKTASLAAAGMLAPSFEMTSGAVDTPLNIFARKSLSLWRPLIQTVYAETGIDVDYRECGTLGIAMTDKDAEFLRDDFKKQRDHGLPLEWFTGSMARALEPALADGIIAAIWAPNDAQIDPVRLIKTLRKGLQDRQVIFEKTIATAIEFTSERVTGIRDHQTNKWTADHIVLAAGRSSVELLSASLPEAIMNKYCLFPVKGEAFKVRQDKLSCAPFPTHVIRGHNVYLCPKMNGEVLIGATSIANDATDTVDTNRIADLRSAANAIMPELRHGEETQRWSGLRPATPDGWPLLGRAEHWPENLWLSTGHYRNGILLAPASAELLADLIESKENFETTHFASTFRPDRKQTPQTIQHL